MILFKKVRWKNFLSTGDMFTEINLTESSTTLIIGENGSGKSTILDALTYVLYSKPFRRINKPQLINTVNNSGMLVEVEFEIGSKEYKIIRGMKPNIFEIYVNGEMLDQDSSVRDYQERLEKYILKLNYKSFTQIIVLGSSSFQPFMQLSAANRREVIEDLLDIGIFSTMNQLLRERVIEIRMNLNKHEQDLKMTDERIEIQQTYIDEVAEIQNNKIEDTLKELDKVEQQRSELELEIQLIQNRVSVLSPEITDLQILRDKISKLQIMRKQIGNNLQKLEADINFYDKNDNCPTCGQVLDYKHVQTILAEKFKISEKVRKGLLEIEEVINVDDMEIRGKEVVEDDIRNNEISITNCANSMQGLNKYIEKLSNDINYLHKVREKSDGDVEKITQLNTLRYQIVESITTLAEEQKYSNTVGDMLKDGGIKTQIIKQYLPVMNNLVNKYLTAMDSYFNFTIDEQFNEVIKSRYRDVFSYASFSEGEKMRIDLALLFTWRAVAQLKNSADTNLLILDEVFDSSLDANGTDEFLKLLQSLDSRSNVFVISHKGDTLYDKFNSTIKFEKVQNFSKVV
jgi:DNA repair exonuclease SbcCD ATPase subunit